MTIRSALVLSDLASAHDLKTLFARAVHADPGGAARIVGHGAILAVYVSPLHGGGAPTVVGMRTAGLARPSQVDAVVPLASLIDGVRSCLVQAESTPGLPARLPVPPDVTGVIWAGISPPRTGWEPLGPIPGHLLLEVARAGANEVISHAPSGADLHVGPGRRARVWRRPLAPEIPGLPAGIAFGAHVLGFLSTHEPGIAYRQGAWSRLTTSRGHVLARTSSLL